MLTKRDEQKLARLRALAEEAFEQLDQGEGIEITGERQLANLLARMGRRVVRAARHSKRKYDGK